MNNDNGKPEPTNIVERTVGKPDFIAQNFDFLFAG